MTQTPPKVLCVGRIYCDLVFSGADGLPRAGEETYADDLQVFAGGGAFITAAYLAGSGVETSLCGVLPNGPFGAAIELEMAASGVDLSACEAAGDSIQPQVTVVISSQHDRAFLTRRAGPALPDCLQTALSDPNLVHLHIAELATLVENPDLVEMAKAHGLTISVDCAWDAAVFSAPGVIDLMRGVDIFLPNEPEVFKLTKDGDSLPEAAQKLAQTVSLVVVKQGAKGASLWASTGLLAEAPAQSKPITDPTGAGDAFNAGFLSRWLVGAASSECLTVGNAFGARAIGKLGGASAARDVPE